MTYVLLSNNSYIQKVFQPYLFRDSCDLPHQSLILLASINPLNDAAKKGLERLEKQMKGVDPDALEEEEENEGEDADADAEEGEFL